MNLDDALTVLAAFGRADVRDAIRGVRSSAPSRKLTRTGSAESRGPLADPAESRANADQPASGSDSSRRRASQRSPARRTLHPRH
jgi:hypothetical protein